MFGQCDFVQSLRDALLDASDHGLAHVVATKEIHAFDVDRKDPSDESRGRYQKRTHLIDRVLLKFALEHVSLYEELRISSVTRNNDLSRPVILPRSQ